MVFYSHANRTHFQKKRFAPSLVLKKRVRLRGSEIKGVKKARDQLWVFVSQRCPFYRESNRGSKERQAPTLGVRLTEVSVL